MTTTRRRRRRGAAAPEALIERLAAIRGRGAGTDAERRAAQLLAAELRAGGRTAAVRPLWVRCEWHAALALAVALALAASILCVTQPEPGLAIAVVAFVAALLDLGGRLPVLRRLTPLRATQNVVSPAPSDAQIRLIITAATDVPRAGTWRRIDAWLGGRAPLVVLGAMLVIVFVAGMRSGGTEEQWVGIVQIPPTIALLCLLAALIETRRLPPQTGANASSAPALALALAARLDAGPPRNLAVEVVLAGAGDSGGASGLAAHIAGLRRQGVGRTDVAVLHIEPCASGVPCWWVGDGVLLRLGLHPQLLRVAEDVASAEAHLEAVPYRGRGQTGALAARRARWPAIAIGTWVERDPASEPADPRALRTSLELATGMIARLDRELDQHAAPSS